MTVTLSTDSGREQGLMPYKHLIIAGGSRHPSLRTCYQTNTSADVCTCLHTSCDVASSSMSFIRS